MTPNQIQSDVLNQDNGRISPEGQLRRSCMRGMVPAGRSGTDSVPLLRGGTYRRAETRGKSDRKITLPIKLSPPIPHHSTTAWRRFCSKAQGNLHYSRAICGYDGFDVLVTGLPQDTVGTRRNDHTGKHTSPAINFQMNALY